MVQYATIDAEHRQGKLHGKPNDDVHGLSLFEELATVLDAEKSLCHHDGTVDPALGADALALRVCHVRVVLPASTSEQYKHQEKM